MAFGREVGPAGGDPPARTIVPAEADALFEQTLDLLNNVFGRPREYYRKQRELDPSVRRQDSLVALVDGRVVSHLQILPREMRVGRSVLKVGGIACLATDPGHRRQGHARALLGAALKLMGSQGYQLSMLFTEFQELFGVHGWKSVALDTYVVNLNGSVEVPEPAGVRRMDPASDLGAVAALHGQYGSAYAGPLVRTLGWWRGNMEWMPEATETFVVLERDGRAAGYARARLPGTAHGDGAGEHYSISDLAATDQAGEEMLLCWLIRDAKERGLSRLSGQAPVAKRAMVALPRLGVQASLRADERMKLRLMDLRSLFRALQPEFSAQLARSGQGVEGTLSIQVGSESVALKVDGKRIEVAEAQAAGSLQLGEEELWRLIFKGETPPFAPPEQAGILRTLFPGREFAFWRADVF